MISAVSMSSQLKSKAEGQSESTKGIKNKSGHVAAIDPDFAKLSAIPLGDLDTVKAKQDQQCDQLQSIEAKQLEILEKFNTVVAALSQSTLSVARLDMPGEPSTKKKSKKTTA